MMKLILCLNTLKWGDIGVLSELLRKWTCPIPAPVGIVYRLPGSLTFFLHEPDFMGGF